MDDSDDDEPRVKRIQTLPKKAPKTPDKEPAVKQLPQLIEAETEGLGYSYIEITLIDIAFPIDDFIEMSVEGTYRRKKISYGKICDTVNLCKILASSRVDEKSKETIAQFLDQTQP